MKRNLNIARELLLKFILNGKSKLVECIQKGRKSEDIEVLYKCLDEYHSQARKKCGIFN